MTPVIVALVGLALLVALAVAVAWQERRRVAEPAITYGVEESISYVCERLGPESMERLRESGVRRILEWSVRYLQDPEVRAVHEGPPVGGGPEAAAYVQERALAMRFSYDADLIVAVLDLQTDFLASLGAIGEAVAMPDDGKPAAAD